MNATSNIVRASIGPWTVEEILDVSEFDKECQKVRLIRNPGGDVAYVAHDTQRQDANARLIAAAPELLAALKELLASELTVMPSFEAGKHAQDAWADRRAKARNDADAAITKAEGRS